MLSVAHQPSTKTGTHEQSESRYFVQKSATLSWGANSYFYFTARSHKYAEETQNALIAAHIARANQSHPNLFLGML
jgi:hypothetical protein